MGFIRRHRSGARGTTRQNAVAVLAILITQAWDQRQDWQVDRNFSVRAFQPSSRRVSKIKQDTSEKIPFNAPRAEISKSSPATTPNTVLLMASGNNKDKYKKNDDNDDISPVFWKDLGKKPGNLIILPFVALFGIDLLLNIFFLAKRTFEYFVLGQAPSTETWF
jgi:hypothetical protein